jgi:hypothetical protein
MKSWVAAPSLFCAGSSVDHAPEYPVLSRTVIEPPDLGPGVDLAPEFDDGELLHATAVTARAAAPATQAVRFDNSRNLTAFTYS